MAGHRPRALAVVAAAVAAIGVVALYRARQARPRLPRRRGTSRGGMEYLVLGDGSRTMLSLPGGPGSELPVGFLGRLNERDARHYADAGYTVWTVTRPRHMPPGHSVADMADDHAQFIREELGGTVDVVLGQSYGGMVAMYLVARHPELVGAAVLAGAAATVEPSAKDVDARWARLRAQGRHARAGAVFLEIFLPDPRQAVLRRVLGPVAGLLTARSATPPGDLLVEADAEQIFDAREILGGISVPTLVVCGDRDEFFSMDAVRETAAGFTDATLVTYAGRGHIGTFSGGDLPRDVVSWLGQRQATPTA